MGGYIRRLSSRLSNCWIASYWRGSECRNSRSELFQSILSYDHQCSFSSIYVSDRSMETSFSNSKGCFMSNNSSSGFLPVHQNVVVTASSKHKKRLFQQWYDTLPFVSGTQKWKNTRAIAAIPANRKYTNATPMSIIRWHHIYNSNHAFQQV